MSKVDGFFSGHFRKHKVTKENNCFKLKMCKTLYKQRGSSEKSRVLGLNNFLLKIHDMSSIERNYIVTIGKIKILLQFLYLSRSLSALDINPGFVDLFLDIQVKVE